jgi:hypothetical protein
MIQHDFAYELNIDSEAQNLLACMEEKISHTLCGLIKQQLLGFGDDMQFEIADSLLDFTYDQVVRSTGCPSADFVLEACYGWIAAELEASEEEN